MVLITTTDKDANAHPQPQRRQPSPPSGVPAMTEWPPPPPRRLTCVHTVSHTSVSALSHPLTMHAAHPHASTRDHASRHARTPASTDMVSHARAFTLSYRHSPFTHSYAPHTHIHPSARTYTYALPTHPSVLARVDARPHILLRACRSTMHASEVEV